MFFKNELKFNEICDRFVFFCVDGFLSLEDEKQRDDPEFYYNSGEWTKIVKISSEMIWDRLGGNDLIWVLGMAWVGSFAWGEHT